MKKILQDLKKKPKKEDQREGRDLVLPRSNFLRLMRYLTQTIMIIMEKGISAIRFRMSKRSRSKRMNV
jgi:hypothetical protein